jgi:hypothetical protein
MDALNKRVYAIDPNILLCTEELQKKQVHAIDQDIVLCTEELQEKQVTWTIEEMHKQACRSILSIAVLMSSKSIVPHLQTYINVYELWHACMHEVFDEANKQPHHPKQKFAQYIQDIPFQKLVVIIPAVCFWVSVKCCDTFSVTTKDVANNIVALHVDRGDRHVHYTLQDLRDAEDALLQLLDFDIYKQQDKIDQMEEYIRAQYGDAYDSSESQRHICEIIYATYLRRPITIWSFMCFLLNAKSMSSDVAFSCSAYFQSF